MKKLLTVTAALVAVAFLAGPTLAEKSVASSITIDDKAGAFTAEGIKKAEDAFHAVTFKSPTHLNIVTYKTVPENKRSEYEAAKANKDEKARFFKNWATDLAEKRGSRGVFVLVSMEGGHIHAIDDRQTDAKRGFDDKDLKTLEEKIASGFKSAVKTQDPAEAKKARDEGLVSGVNYVIAELKNTSAPETPDQKVAAKKAGGGLSILQWVLIIGGGLLVMWLVIGIIRALTGGGGGGGGYGGGGGGGGGFMSGLMGGLFGAMAGMYLYNSMFGGGMHDASASGSDGYSGDGGNYDNGAGDYDGGGDGGGTDFDAGGGDAGAGGDWGGGGGDFGGGGGDFGGGGDW